MIILDTNVISELMKLQPNGQVLDWLDDRQTQPIWTTSVSLFEVRFGLAQLPEGNRKRGLHSAFDFAMENVLEHRLFDFDFSAAIESARIAADLRAVGRTVDIRDIQIAGIVSAHHGILLTRNVKDFAGTGVNYVNPWIADGQ